MALRLPHERLGEVPQVANPMRLSATPPAYRGAPPLLGEHTAEVLREVLGMDETEVSSLRAKGIV